MMRKLLACMLLAILLALVCGFACAETYVLDTLLSSVDVPDDYVVLKSDNLPQYADWLASNGKDIETVTNDFIKRGVLLQCWSPELDACFELTATKDSRTESIFDVNEQDESMRRSYRLGFYPDNDYQSEGYSFTSADWKNAENGRFLILKYSKRDGGEVLHRGFMRRTIRNGYEITLDMQIHGRATNNKDNANLNIIWESFRFIEVLPLPPAASARINITQKPPAQTKEQSFTIKGTAAEGVKLTAVTMGLNYPTPILNEVSVPKNGKFSIPISLPKEGVFVTTVTAEYKGEDVVELLYPVTYQRTLLVVNVTSEVPNTVTEDELVISGNAEPGASIQVLVNSEPSIKKRVTAAGKFKLEIDTHEEGDYNVTLVFTKTGLAEQRKSFSFVRRWSQDDMIKQLKKQAIKPSYTNLVKKIDAYSGRIMGYNAYLMSATKSGSQWILHMALNKKRDTYSNIIIVTSAEEPSFEIGEKILMYGTCVGMSEISVEEGSEAVESYPCFGLLLLASLD